MKKLIVMIIAYSLASGGSVLAQGDKSSLSERLDRIENQLFSDSSISHHEYKSCITHWVNACNRDREGRIVSLDHGPSLSETLDWIGHQLTSNGLAHYFDYDGCKVAIDQMEGTPVWMTWTEQIGRNVEYKEQSLLSPVLATGLSAKWFAGNGHVVYLNKDRFSHGTADTPRRVVFYNDAGVMDLSQLQQIKNYIGTYGNGELRPVKPKYGGEIKLKYLPGFPKDALATGTGFADGDAPLFDRLEQLPESPDSLKKMFSGKYFFFNADGPYRAFFLMHRPYDVELNIKLTKAFLHAINMCNKPRAS